MKLLRVLFLEDSEADRDLIQRELQEIAAVTLCDRRESFESEIKNPFDVILIDLKLWDITGEEAIQIARSVQPETPIIIVTGSVNGQAANAACELGAVGFWLKDRLIGFKRAVQRAYEKRQLEDEKKKLEEEKLRLEQNQNRDQRLEILGQLSAGIVHDMNGVLQIFIMGVDQLRGIVAPQGERILHHLESATKRGAEMTAQVLSFARGANGPSFKSVSVAYLLGEIGQLVRATFPANIRLETKPSFGTASVKCDATQIIQVLTNLALNARDAMEKGGTLTIEAHNVSITNGMHGPSVCIEVRDTGTGIPPEVLPNIWEPFFTTKPAGQGTGLGLPTVKRIVEAHHGTVKVLTGPEGTVFFVYLPIAIPWTSSQTDDETTFDGAGKTVLLVDDQASFRDLAKMILETANFKVILAGNGPEALNYFRVGQQIDVMITDESMPAMSGSDLARNIRSVGLQIPIIIVSGYDAKTDTDLDVNAQLQKPVTTPKLLSTLKRVLTNPVEPSQSQA